MDDDWDLHAVVRACAAAVTNTNTTIGSATTTTTTNSPFPSLPSFPSHEEEQNSHNFPDLLDGTIDPLQEIYQEFCGDHPPPAAAAASTSILATPAANVYQEIVQMKPPPPPMMQIQENVQFINSPPFQNFQATVPQPTRPRRRKNQQIKMVRQMTQEELAADSWAWRKYGQKPIKGSPYPRNYYRCSTSKGCAARKQVERSPNDPEIFVVSYTGEHTHPRPTHRSSLAGRTRSKFASPPKIVSSSTNNNALLLHQIPSSSSAASFSPTTPSTEGETAAQNDDVEMNVEEDDQNIIVIPDDLMNDDHEDMFKGFQDSDQSSGGAGDLFSSGLLSSPPWTPTSSTGGGI